VGETAPPVWPPEVAAATFDDRPFAGLIGTVTGASGDIGGAIALALADLGATVYIAGRRAGALAGLAERAGANAPRMIPHSGDLTVSDEIARLADRLRREAGRLDFLVHSAGIFAIGPRESAETFDLQYATNVRAPYLLTKALVPLLTSSRGQVVFINSTAALHVRAGMGQYAATKHACRALADTLREEVNGEGIRVLSVYPGRTATRSQAEIFADEGRAYQPSLLLQPADIAAMVVAALRLPRTAEVTEIKIRSMVKSY